MPVKTVEVPNISCGHCVRAIENELGDMEGVRKVTASQETRLVTIEWEDPQSWDNIKATMQEINYPPAEN
jgi:copper chaperone